MTLQHGGTSFASATWGDVNTKWGATLNTCIRVLLLPVYLVAEAMEMSTRIVYDEPPNYWAGRIAHSVDGLRPLLTSTGTLGEEEGKPPSALGFHIILRRFVECWHESWMLFFQAVVYLCVILPLVSLLGLEHLGKAWTVEIQSAVAFITGQYINLTDGRRIPVSLANLVDSSFHAPYDVPREFPDKAPPEAGCVAGAGPITAHFMSLCAKLMYEDMEVIHDVVVGRWGMEWYGYEHLPATNCKDGYVPDIVWAYFGNSRARVLAFKGAEPLLQIDRRTDIPVAMTHHQGVGGVNDGFYRGLMQPDPSCPGKTLFHALLTLLESVPEGQPLYLVGHSLGAAAAVNFAALVVARFPELVTKVGGIYSYGAPRSGDTHFCQNVDRAFQGRIFRYVHGCDVVCRLPSAGFGYAHHGQERLITSFPTAKGRILKREEDEELVEKHLREEDAWAYPYSLMKIYRNAMQDNWGYAIGRAMTFPLPGISDHTPCEYERALRDCLQ